jgi:hypothetical protein
LKEKIRNLLKDKKFYLCPYNELTIKLYKSLKINDGFLGFIDNQKKGSLIYPINEIKDHDYVLIESSNYCYELAKSFDRSKVYILKSNELHPFEKDITPLELKPKEYNYDILFLVYNKSNVIDASLVIREIIRSGHTAAIIETNTKDTENLREGLKLNNDIEFINFNNLCDTNFKTLVCSVDWINREFIKRCQCNDIKTIGMVDGIEDFNDTDYKFDRKAYQTVEYVLLTGINNLKYFEYKKNKCFVVGLPKIYSLWNSKVFFPKKITILINLNFTYGVMEEFRESWLNEVTQAITSLGIKYKISQHHADNGIVDSKVLTKANVYEAIKDSTLVVSRFSTIISESLALGKPVVYHNPHNEESPMYKNPLNAFSISQDMHSLKKMIIKELSNLKDVRERAKNFLNNNFNILSKTPHAELAAKKIIEITEYDDR